MRVMSRGRWCPKKAMTTKVKNTRKSVMAFASMSDSSPNLYALCAVAITCLSQGIDTGQSRLLHKV